MINTGAFVAHRLQPHDARSSFVLARLARPGLSLRDWTRAIRQGARQSAAPAIVGVRNQAGCFVALLCCSGGDLRIIIASAVVTGARPALIAAARTAVAVPI